MHPEINHTDYSKWGVAVVDLDWKTYDPSCCEAKPLDYELQPTFQVLSFPIIGGKSTVIHIGFSALTIFGNN